MIVPGYSQPSFQGKQNAKTGIAVSGFKKLVLDHALQVVDVLLESEEEP